MHLCVMTVEMDSLVAPLTQGSGIPPHLEMPSIAKAMKSKHMFSGKICLSIKLLGLCNAAGLAIAYGHRTCTVCSVSSDRASEAALGGSSL